MAIGAAEALVLVGLVVGLFALLTPVRHRLERWIGRRLSRRRRGGGRVVVLERRRDGTFGRQDPHGR
jgi:hypothetical protein